MTESSSVPAWLQEATSTRTIREHLRATLAPYNLSEQTADALVYQLVGGVGSDSSSGVINLGYCPDHRTQTPALFQFLAKSQSNVAYANAAATLSYTGLFGTAVGEDGFDPGLLLSPDTRQVYLDNSTCLNDRAVQALTQVVSTQSYSVTLHDTTEVVKNDVGLTLVSPTGRDRKPGEDTPTFLADTLGITPQLYTALDLVVYDDGLTVLSDADPLTETRFQTTIDAARECTPTLDDEIHQLLQNCARDIVKATGSDAAVHETLQKVAEASARLHLNDTVQEADVNDAVCLLTDVLQGSVSAQPETMPAPAEPDSQAMHSQTDSDSDKRVIDPETGEVREAANHQGSIMVADEDSTPVGSEVSEDAPEKLQSFFEGATQAEAAEDQLDSDAQTDEAPKSSSPIIEAGPAGATIESETDGTDEQQPQQTETADESDIITDTGYGAVDLGTAASSTVEQSLNADQTPHEQTTSVQREEDDHAIVEIKKSASTPEVSTTDVKTMATLVNDLGADYEGCKVPGEVVFTRAKQEGLSVDDAAAALHKLTDSGEIIYYKRTGHFLSP